MKLNNSRSKLRSERSKQSVHGKESWSFLYNQEQPSPTISIKHIPKAVYLALEFKIPSKLSISCYLDRIGRKSLTEGSRYVVSRLLNNLFKRTYSKFELSRAMKHFKLEICFLKSPCKVAGKVIHIYIWTFVLGLYARWGTSLGGPNSCSLRCRGTRCLFRVGP